MIRYQNIHGYSVNFTPWLDLGYRLVSLELKEKIGGDLAGGSIRMVGSLSVQESLELRDTYSGTISILDFGIPIKEFKVFFIKKLYKREEIILDFVCIPLPDYVRDFHSKTHVGDLKSIIEGIFIHPDASDFLDIRCESDIQGTMKLYQSNESDISFLKNIISGYVNGGIYGYSWDKLIIKKTCTPEELENAVTVEALDEEQSFASNTYDKSLYSTPKNLWEEGKDDPRVGEDYSDRQPIFVRACSFMGDEVKYMGVDQYNMIMNSKKNIANLESDYFQKLNITIKTFPKYNIGDVVEYYKTDEQSTDKILPYKYYLVYGNRMFFSTSGTGVTDPNVPKNIGDYTFTTTLLGLEEDGSIAIDKTEEQDPTLEKQGDPDYLERTEDSSFTSNMQNTTNKYLPKL